MKFEKPIDNPMRDILLMFPYNRWIELTPGLLEAFKRLIRRAGFIPENIEETSRAFDLLEEMKLIEIEIQQDKNPLVRRIVDGI